MARCTRSARIRSVFSALAANAAAFQVDGRASRRRSPPRSTALPMPRASCIRPGVDNAAMAAIAGNSAAFAMLAQQPQGAERGRGSFERLRGARRASAGAGRDHGQCVALQQLRQQRQRVPRCRVQGGGGCAPGEQRRGVPEARQRQWRDGRAVQADPQVFSAMATNAAAFASLASNAQHDEPAAHLGDRQQCPVLLQHGQQCRADQRGGEGPAGDGCAFAGGLGGGRGTHQCQPRRRRCLPTRRRSRR